MPPQVNLNQIKSTQVNSNKFKSTKMMAVGVTSFWASLLTFPLKIFAFCCVKQQIKEYAKNPFFLGKSLIKQTSHKANRLTVETSVVQLWRPLRKRELFCNTTLHYFSSAKYLLSHLFVIGVKNTDLKRILAYFFFNLAYKKCWQCSWQ